MSTVNGRYVIHTTAHVADATLTVDDNGTCHTNTGASGAVQVTLPVATPGLHFKFSVGVAQQLRINPNGTDTISLPSTGVPGAAGKYLWADAVGESVQIVCAVANSWAVFGYTGTWTSEA